MTRVVAGGYNQRVNALPERQVCGGNGSAEDGEPLRGGRRRRGDGKGVREGSGKRREGEEREKRLWVWRIGEEENGFGTEVGLQLHYRYLVALSGFPSETQDSGICTSEDITESRPN